VKARKRPAALAPLRHWYRAEVKATAAVLALRFQARKFDNATAEPEGLLPFQNLEDVCGELPICRDNATARIVIAVSRYAGRAPLAPENIGSVPPNEKLWNAYAAWCLARDVHDEAVARGWARSRSERSWPQPAYRGGP
jgi:hypothetical protein